MKYIAFIGALAMGVTFLSTLAEAGNVTLRNSISVEEEQVTFGDIFKGAGDLADYVIAPAPAPGKSTTFKASSVAFVARKHGLEWRPNRPIQRISIRRSGIRISQQHILKEIHFALEAELQSDLFELALSTQHPNIQVSANEDPFVAVESLSYSSKGDNFVAVLLAPAHSENARKYKVTGKIYRQALIPVTSRSIAAGEEILEQDIDYKVVRLSKIGRTTATDIQAVIGKSPRRALRAGSPLKLNNLGNPVTVKKGKLVAVTLKNGGINLTITGRTLEDGQTGDIIRVENIASRKTIQAEVISSREVRIISAKQRLASIQ